MAKKRYVSLTGIQYTFPVVIQAKEKEKVLWISFKGNENDYATANKDVQDAIEATQKFKNKEIALAQGQIPDQTPDVFVSGFESVSFESVTDINGAVQVLSGEPYKMAKNKLKSPDDIKAAMQTCNVSFPNFQP